MTIHSLDLLLLVNYAWPSCNSGAQLILLTLLPALEQLRALARYRRETAIKIALR